MQEQVQTYQEMFESREALVSATGLALDHVIEQAKFELGALHGVQANEPNRLEEVVQKSYTLQTLINIRAQLARINQS